MYDRLQGVLPQPIGEGSHFRVPWLQSPNIMDIRTRPRTISSVTGTKGKQTGNLHCSISLDVLLWWFLFCGRGFAYEIVKHQDATGTMRMQREPVQVNKLMCVRVHRLADGEHLPARAVEARHRGAVQYL